MAIEQNDLQVHEMLARIDERTERLVDDVDQLKHTLLEGNGVPAITVQVATLNTEVATLKQQARDYRIPRHVWIGIVISALIGLTGILADLKVL